MGFWNEIGTDPKRKFRWFVQLGGADGESLQLAAKNVEKPKFEISTTDHKFINHTFYFPGRLTWQPISATFVDIGGDDDISEILSRVITASGYEPPEDAEDCRRSITKQASVEAFGTNFSIKQVDGEGQPVEEWQLTNPWVSKIEYGSLDYTSEDLVEITMTIVYDHAKKVL